MPFKPAALRFLRQLKANNRKPWFESHRPVYEAELREPMRALIEEMNKHFARFAPEIAGDPKRSMFRIHRDTRFSKDKSPYKTNAACWFSHRRASRKVGGEATEGSAGFYFHLEPGGNSFVGAGLWMPPRPQLNRIRDAIADDPKAFTKMTRSISRFGGLDATASLKRMPRGYPDEHPAGRWLRLQSFTTGRGLTDAQVTKRDLPALLSREYRGMLPLVRWLNGALGYSARA